MKTIYLLGTVLLFIIIHSNAYAQFEVFLPSENEYVKGEYYDDWIVNDKSEYSGKYKYFKDEWETKVYDAFLIIKSSSDNILFELNEKYNNDEMQNFNETLNLNSEGFKTATRSGIFRKLFYRDKRGNQKISYQIRINGDCCDGACDDYFERTEILSENKGMGVRDDFGFKILGKDISFNITESKLLEAYPNLTAQKSEKINGLIYYSLEEKVESDFDFLRLYFSFFENELYEIDIQNNFNDLISKEIVDLTNSFDKTEEIKNIISSDYINIPTIIYKNGDLKITLTEVRFTFCTITNELIEKKLRDLHPEYFNYKY